jgi:hypothetical protein
MQIFVIVLSVIFGLMGFYLGYSSYRQHGDITKTAEPVSMSQVLKIALISGFASGLVFFALVAILGTLAENKTDWTFQEFLSLGVVSAAIGVVVFLGSTYQIRWTIKYRDYLIDKYKVKK